MIPAGYMLKRVVTRPDWLPASNVIDLYSASNCFSESLADIDPWELNGFGLGDSPALLEELARAHSIDTNGMTLFYYEAFEKQYDEDELDWVSFAAEAAPEAPLNAILHGYDVATYSTGFGTECSPLSCNSLAEELAANEHCLFSSLDEARTALEDGRFDNSEPGPFRIVAVYTVPRSTSALV